MLTFKDIYFAVQSFQSKYPWLGFVLITLYVWLAPLSFLDSNGGLILLFWMLFYISTHDFKNSVYMAVTISILYYVRETMNNNGFFLKKKN